MLTLHQPNRAFGLPNPSAFCVKLETYLRMAEIPYQIGYGQPKDAPKGKVPWIVDDDVALGDSALIIDYLKKKHGDPLDSRLTARQHALGHALRKVVEDSLYFVSSYSKWVDDAGFEIYAAELFAGMPEELLDQVPPAVRKRAVDKLHAQGIGRHTADEVYAIGVQDVRCFREFLGDGDYLFGDAPTSYDASAFGVVGNLKDGPFSSPVRDVIRSTPEIADYLDRIRSRYFADLQVNGE